MEQDIERWKRELREAGWIEYRITIWRAPGGQLFRGPYHAWQVMTQRKKSVEGNSTGEEGKRNAMD